MEEKLSLLIEEGSEPKSIDAIVDKVLGTSFGYIKGLGYGPKPIEKVSHARFVKMKETLTNAWDELQQDKSHYEVIRDQMETITQALLRKTLYLASFHT